MHAKSLQSYLILWDPMDCSLPGSSVHGILQTKILEWVARLCPGDHPNPGDEFLHLPTLAGLKTQHSENQDHGIWSHHFMANRWGKQWKQFETMFLGSEITTDGDCTHEIKRLLGRKAMTNLDSILKSRDITLPTKVHLVKYMVLPVVMYGCESWTIKKAEHQRIDAFELWCWRRLLRVLWTARRSNQSITKEISPEYSLELLKLQYFGHLVWRTDWLEKTLMLGKIGSRRRRWRQRMWWLDGMSNSMNISLSKLRE